MYKLLTILDCCVSTPIHPEYKFCVCLFQGQRAMGKSRKRTKLSHTTGYPYKTGRIPNEKGAVQLHGSACFAASPLFSAQQGRLAQSNDEDLKRLGFVQSYSGFCLSKSYSMASSVYNTSLAYTPARVNSSVRAVEGAISDYTVPMVTAVQKSSWRALHQLDHQVDGAILTAHHLFFAKQTPQANQQLVELHEARSKYLPSVQEGVAFLKEHGLVETARYATDVVLGRVEPQRLPHLIEAEAEDLVQRIGDAWGRVANMPPVAKVVATAQPPVEYTRSKYREAHSAVVGSAAYNRALDIADGMVKRVQETYVYQVAANRLYPVVSPIADPALDKLTHSPVYTAVRDHLTPSNEDGLASSALPALCAKC